MLGPEIDLHRWAASGAMALTGRSDGPPLAVPGRPAGAVADALDRIRASAGRRTGICSELPGVAILGERAAITELSRQGPTSCGGTFRLLRTRDGWCGLNLARPSDVDLVPALVESASSGDPWSIVTRWAAGQTSSAVEERCRLLGLPGSAVEPRPPARRAPVLHTAGGRRTALPDRPLVVDFSSLWAGPLCTHLLNLCGVDVVKVEARHRPDGARRGPVAFFDLLHAGKSSVAVDLDDPRDLDALQRLIAGADLVVESSRVRALTAIGIDAHAIVADGTSWLSITARGRDDDAVGFGDDVAAGAGLVADDSGKPVPVGDAIADPLTGVLAAAEAAEALECEDARIIDVSMHDVAASVVGGVVEHAVERRGDLWWLRTAAGEVPVAEPRARAPRSTGPSTGADNDRFLR